MALYHLEIWQNNVILNRTRHWRSNSFGFVIEVEVSRRSNNRPVGSSNRMYHRDDLVFLSESGMRQFLIRTLSAEQMFSDNGVQLIRHISPSRFSPRTPVLSLDSLVHSVLEMSRMMRNSHSNRSLTLLPIQFTLHIDEFRQSQFLDDSIILDGQSLGVGLQRLDDSVILEGRPLELVAGLSSTAAVPLLKEEKVQTSDTECSVCLESLGVGETVARLPCSHLFHTGCITRWLHKKPSCPLCRAPAC